MSVIIPAFNHWTDATKPLLDTLAAQRLGAEILVVDDGSTDETKDYFAAAPFVVVHQPNGGFASACNVGAQYATGEYLVFLNNDTTPQPGWLAPLVAELARGAGIVGARLVNPLAPGDHLVGGYATQSAGLACDERGVWSNLNFLKHPPEDGPYDAAAVTGACLGLSRTLFWQAGGFDEGFRQGGCEDVDLCLRVAKLGRSIRVVPDSIVVHHEGTTRFALSGAQEAISANQRRLRERWGPGREEAPARVPTAGLRVAWDGPTDLATGGSLAVINRAVLAHLPDAGIRLVAGGDAAALTVLHAWPGTEPHRVPDTPFCVIQPWELGAPPAAWRQTWAHPNFRELWVPSQYCRALYERHEPSLAGRVRVIPNGVDTAVFRPDGLTWPTKQGAALTRFLFVGGAIWRKGIDVLEAAWARAFSADDPVRLLVKTTGSATFYRDSAQAIGGPHVRVLDDQLSTDDLASLYRTVDVLVAPSRAEACCLPVLEAMASGLPVLVPDLGPTEEYVDDTCALRLRAEWRDPPHGLHYEVPIDELARALRWCADPANKEHLNCMGEAGRQKALAYDWRHIAPRYAAAIREVCDGH